MFCLSTDLPLLIMWSNNECSELLLGNDWPQRVIWWDFKVFFSWFEAIPNNFNVTAKTMFLKSRCIIRHKIMLFINKNISSAFSVILFLLEIDLFSNEEEEYDYSEQKQDVAGFLSLLTENVRSRSWSSKLLTSGHFVSLQDNAVLIPRRKKHASANKLSRAVHQCSHHKPYTANQRKNTNANDERRWISKNYKICVSGVTVFWCQPFCTAPRPI